MIWPNFGRVNHRGDFVLTTCPACGADLEGDERKAGHIAGHSPDDFGLSRNRIDLTPPADCAPVVAASPDENRGDSS